jgi:tRNA nucleotidyltransferase (CCA-adding enzyme)
MPNMMESNDRIVLEIVPEHLQVILDRFIQRQCEVWLVGGALRDLLLGRAPKDWDLATNASPRQVMAIFPRVIPIGLRHGTVQIHSGEMKVEVVSCPGAGFEGILADLKRRDFTVNALALSYPGGKLIDPFGGQRDLVSRTLRAVGDARARFHEDPLRTLRAGRFMSVYGFHIEPETFTALKDAAPELDRVARERVREELFKMLPGDYFSDAFGWMVRGGVIEEILPEIVARNDNSIVRCDQSEMLDHTVNTVHLSPPRLRVRLAALFHNLAGLERACSDGERTPEQSGFHRSAVVAAEIMRRLRAARKEERAVASLVENQIPDGAEFWTDAEVRRFLARAGDELLDDVLDLAHAERLARKDAAAGVSAFDGFRSKITRERERKRPLRIQDLAINGLDVMKIIGLSPGPLVGQLLQSLHRQVLADPTINERKILMDFMVKEYHIKFRDSVTKGG